MYHFSYLWIDTLNLCATNLQDAKNTRAPYRNSLPCIYLVIHMQVCDQHMNV